MPSGNVAADSEVVMEDSDTDETVPVQGENVETASRKSKKGKKRKLAEPTSLWDDYVSGDEDTAKGKGGAIMDSRLKKISLPCYRTDDKKQEKKLVRCLGMKLGCPQTWVWPRQKGRIFAHASSCSYLSELERKTVQEINTTMASEAPSVKLAEFNEQLAKKRRITLTASPGQDLPSASSIPPTNWPIFSIVTTSAKLAPKPPAALSNSQTNVGDPSPLTAQKISPDDSKSMSIVAISKRAKAQQVTMELDYAVMRFIVASGIPPTAIDLPEWKDMWMKAKPNYSPASSSKMVDTLLPRECSNVRQVQVERFRKSENLSISFDGNTTRSSDSVYTFHITTPDRISFLFEGNAQSDKSHDAEHLSRILTQVRLVVLLLEIFKIRN